MQTNPSPMAVAEIIWDGTASTPVMVSQHAHFGFNFKVLTALTADAVIEVRGHNGTAADPCVPGPAQDIPEIAKCHQASGAVPAANSRVTIPQNTPVGQICYFTLDCKPFPFMSVTVTGGPPANLRGTIVLKGPMR